MKGRFAEYGGLRVTLPGKHQVVNSVTALGAVEALAHRYRLQTDIDSLRRGLYNTVWPGRCETIARVPLILLDGAQNRAAAAALRETVKESFSFRRLILVLGLSADKDIRAVCRELVPLADSVVITRADNPRASGTDVIEKEVLRVSERLGGCVKVLKTVSVGEAMEKAKSEAEKEDMILVAGSLFLAGEARDVITGRF